MAESEEKREKLLVGEDKTKIRWANSTVLGIEAQSPL